jgi:uncharacterized membrane protein YbaN (DUF454 family)
MAMDIGQIVLFLAVILLLLVILAGIPVFLIYLLPLSKRYVAYKAELQKTGKYQEWVLQHKGLVTFERISLYVNFVFLIAMLVFGLGEKIVNNPSSASGLDVPLNFLTTISGVLVYLFFPYVLISLFINSRLYKKVTKDWQQHQ